MINVFMLLVLCTGVLAAGLVGVVAYKLLLPSSIKKWIEGD